MDVEDVLNKLYDLPVKIVEMYKPGYVPLSEFIRVSCLYGDEKFIHFTEIASFFNKYIGDMKRTRELLMYSINLRSVPGNNPYFLIVVPMIYHGKRIYAVLSEAVGNNFIMRVSRSYYTPNWRQLVKIAAYYGEDPRYFNLISYPSNGRNWLTRIFQGTKSITVPIPIIDLWLEYGLDHLVKHFIVSVLNLITNY